MITQFQNTRNNYLSRTMVLPVLFILFCAFAIRISHKKTALVASKTVIVVIDAGHGGIDVGAISETGINEKDINLGIAKKIQQLSRDYNVKIVMTRDKDELPGKSTSIEEGLKYRTGLAAESKADIFVSIHVNSDPKDPSKNGFDMYVPDNNSSLLEKNIRLGSILTEEIKKDYIIAGELKKINQGIAVLNHSAIPAIIVECGYITNSKDLAYIGDEQNQEKIAKDILEGIVKYAASANYTSNYIMPVNQDTISPAEAAKIDVKHISSMIVLKEKNLIIIKFETGDSVMVKADEFKKYNDGLKKDTYKDHGKTFTKVEVEAEYPGGQQGWTQYLIKNLKYPPDAAKREVQGTVLMQFIVETDGTLSDIKVLERPDPSLSEVSYRIIKNSGKWIPAKQNGKKVRCYKKQPIVFKLES